MLLVGSARADTPRTLVYRFSVDPIPLRTGTIRVTIEQPRPDGRQNAVVDEGIDKAARASTTLHCTIYGATTEIDCVPMAEATGEELSVLEFLGASFYNPRSLDAHGHWRTSPRIGDDEVVSDFGIAKRDGDALSIRVTSRYREIANNGFNSSETGTVLYNAARGVPESIRLRDFDPYGGQVEQALDLVSDSLAKSASPNSH